MSWTILDMALFAIIALGSVVLIVTFPAAWRSGRADIRKIEHDLERARREGGSQAIDDLRGRLEQKTGELQRLNRQLGTLPTGGQPLTREDLLQLHAALAQSAEVERQQSFFRDVGLGFLFTVLGALLPEIIKLLVGK